MATLMFPLGVRLSTWVILGVFLVFGVRDRRFLLAAVVWLAGFEVVWQLTGALRRIYEAGGVRSWRAAAVLFVAYGIGLVVIVFAARHGIRPYLPLMLIVAGIWVVWVATGFHINDHSMINFDAGAEAMNEAAKTLWGVAYLIPLLLISSPQRSQNISDPSPRFQGWVRLKSN